VSVSPYRTPIERATRPPPRPEALPDADDRAVHGVIAGIGMVGVLGAVLQGNFHAGFALAALLVVIGFAGVLRGSV
jgi:hypothetical protein